MAKDPKQVNPLQILWNNEEVREHVFTAGIALAQAVRAGAEAIQAEIKDSDLPQQYPYLERAVGSIVETVGGTSTAAQDAPKREPAPEKRVPTKKKPVRKKRPAKTTTKDSA